MKKIVTTFSIIFFIVLTGFSQKFITTWQTDITTAEETTISIPIEHTSGTYDIDWGDGIESNGINTINSGQISHTYENTGTYTVSIDFINAVGVYIDFDGLNGSGATQIVSIEQWGGAQWASMSESFAGCSNLVLNATDAPNLSQVDNMRSMFRDAALVNADLNNWDVSNVTTMSGLFLRATSFNGNISSWDVSNVENMGAMFRDATSFNQDIGMWDVSSVTAISTMFSGATSFNQDISNWDMSSVINMSSMFSGATSFNQSLNTWNVSLVEDMSSMFSGATSFNQDLSNWDISSVGSINAIFNGATTFNGNVTTWNVSNIEDMTEMFSGATAFNQDLNNWDVSNVQFANSMFSGASTFNGDISNWDVSSLTSMSLMFLDASSFNGQINSWDVSNVVGVSSMFQNATSFNQDLSGWELTSVESMFRMFQNATSFNQNVSGWDVSNVTDMRNVFADASSFNQDLGSWNISMVTNMDDMLRNSGLSIMNYDNTLLGWAAQNVQSAVTLGASGLVYCGGTEARDQLINQNNWNIFGDNRGVSQQSIDLGEDLLACVGDELTFSIDESNVDFQTYTISTLFGNSSTDGSLTFIFDETFAATASTQEVLVTIELIDESGCVGTDQVQIFDNTMTNWGIGALQNNDPDIIISNTILPETSDSFEWDFGDGNTNTTDVNPTYTYSENGDYDITLTVSNECGEESLSTSVSIQGVEDPIEEDPLGLKVDRILIYPNPVTTRFRVETSKELEVQLFSLDGKKVHSANTRNGFVDISNLDTGQYIIHLIHDGKIESIRKIIKRN